MDNLEKVARDVFGSQDIFSRPSVQAYAPETSKNFLANTYGVGTAKPDTSATKSADHTVYEFPDGVGATTAPVTDLSKSLSQDSPSQG